MGKPKKASKKRKRSSGVDSEKKTILNTGTSHTLVVDDGIVCDILSRLPVKSLSRFKCVSKHWCSLIEDPYFVDLHFRTSKTRARLLFLIPPPESQPKIKNAGIRYQEVCFQTADLLSEVTSREVPIFHNIRTLKCNLKSFRFTDMLGAINGLICLTNGFEDSIFIYNISSGKGTPLVKSESRDNAVPGGISKGKSQMCPTLTCYTFGFDPVTKHYKVICHRRVFKKDGNRNIGGQFWEVLTLGNNSWRRIEEIPSLPDGLTSSSVYVKGSIYWLPAMFERGNRNWKFINNDRLAEQYGVYIMAFDVGSEEFRRIRLPNFIVDQPMYPCPPLPGRVHIAGEHLFLQEVNGCLTVMRKVDDSVVKLWIHEVNGDGIGSWNERNIALPRCCMQRSLFSTLSFHSVAGTDQLILQMINQKESSRDKKITSLFSCNWQEKVFEEMKINGIPSSATLCTSYTESLFSFPGAENQQLVQPSS